MLTKQQKYLQRQWIKGHLDIAKTARKMGYRGARVTKGMEHIKSLMSQMHIHVI